MPKETLQEDVGEITCSRLHPSISVEWKIRDYLGFPQEMNHSLVSPVFKFLDCIWCLRLYPNGDSTFHSAGWISAYLEKKHSKKGKHKILFSFGIKEPAGSIAYNRQEEHTFKHNYSGYGWSDFLKPSELKRKRNEILPGGVLTVFCHMSGEVRKNVHPSEMEKPQDLWQERISSMYRTMEFSDVGFLVKERVFQAHRFVLCTRSQEFARILFSPDVSIDEHIHVEESVTEAAFDILLRFLYTNTLETTDKQSIVETHHCAVVYQVPDLQTMCEKEIDAWDITTEEVFTLLDFGLDVPNLRDKCMDLLRKEGLVALSSPAFLQISRKSIGFVLESGVLENIPGLKRIERIVEWCEHLNPEVVADYTSVRKKLLDDGSAEKNLLGRLEFERLELEDMSRVVASYCGLLTPEELVNFLIYRKTMDTSILPEWCLPGLT